MKKDIWASDVRVSQPEPPEDRPVQVDFGGMGFTTGGIAHNISEADREEIFSPHYSPDGENPNLEELASG
jgi:hypothetical protein